MIKIEVADCKVETSREDTLPNGRKRWIKYVLLDLLDKTDGKNIHIPEWYYAIVCNREYIENPIRSADLENTKYIVIQDEFVPQVILDNAREKVGAMDAETWDEAFEYLDKHYLKDD